MAVTEINEQTFTEQVLESPIPVLVDFWAEWCSPCHVLAKALDGVSESFSGKLNFVKINVDENPNAHAQWGVRALPTIMLFRDSKVVDSKIGAMSSAQLDEWLSASLIES